MEELGPKKNIPLSMDRAVFLLLRVKKAFKKKRYLRKDKPTQTVGASLPSQSRTCNKLPPPLHRSRTLPAIVTPGMPVLPSKTDSSHIYSDDLLRATKYPVIKCITPSNKADQSIISRKPLVSPGADSSIVQRRKSTDTTCTYPKRVGCNSSEFKYEQLNDISNVSHCAGENGINNNNGSLLLRIPSPSVLAAKAYRIPQSKIANPEEYNKMLNYYSRDYNPKTSNTESTTSAPLNRLVQYLHQTSTKSSHNDHIFPGPSEPTSEDVPRRLSWERRRTNIALKRSASINSVIEAFWSNSPRPSLDISHPFVTSFNKRPSTSSLLSNCSTISQNTQLNINYNEVGSSSSAGSSRRESLLSPSSTRKNKLRRLINDNVVQNNENNIVLRADRNLVDETTDEAESFYIGPSFYRFGNCSDYSNKCSFNKDIELSYDSPLELNESCLSSLNSKSLRAVVTCELETQAEMEYLIPNGGVTLLSSNLDVVSRNHTPFSKMSQPKNVKLNATETCCDENMSLSTKLQAKSVFEAISVNTNTRSKGGNTPHRNKMSKKQLKTAQAQLDKYAQSSVHLHALFSAVEHGHLEKARTILESTDVDVNSLNSDGLSALDVAVLSNNRSMTKMLLQHGALEGSQFSTDSLGTKLNALLKDAESRIQDLNDSPDSIGAATTFTSRPSISSIIIGNTSSSVTGCTGNEIDKQIGIWERRIKGLRRVLLGWDQARPPDAPSSVTVDVTDENSITVHLLEPTEGAIATKFEVQWSTRLDFNNIVGKRQIMEWVSFQGTMGSKCYISGLTQGRRYFIRAMCGNVKGWGLFKTSVPVSVVPSSWRDISHCQDRYLGRQRLLDNLFTAVRLARPADVSDLTLDSSTVQRRNPKKKTTIKQLFSGTSKFQKNLRRGIYLSSIIYCDDKVLVTNEDFLPVIEIDETYPSTLHNDYHWLMKVACSWDDVKSLRSDMERNLTSAVHFRTKLLSAVCHMQSALGLTDLGILYYKPLRDSHGTIVLTSVQALRTQKAVSILNTRWLPISKLQKKIVALHEDYNISEKLILSVGDQIHYHQSSMQPLESGLYLGYLKMQCSVEQIQVLVPVKTPNVLPHCKVRDNSHINAEEWQILKKRRNKNSDSATLPVCFNANSSEMLTEAQHSFLCDLTKAIRKLLNYMNIPAEDASTHRLYDLEVIEYSKDISFLIICPSVELICAVPGQPEILLQNDHLISLSIQAFEMIHLNTYQPGIIQKYSRLSCVLELDMSLASHSQREAFSSSEVQTAKERLSKLQELTANLNSIWKSVRWLMDVIAFARDKNVEPSITLQDIIQITEFSRELRSDSCNQPSLLQLPVREGRYNKGGSGRGSWPGSANSSQAINMEVEHSKSEQNLGRNEKDVNIAERSEPQQVSAIKERGGTHLLQVGQDYRNIIDNSLRKSSADSITSECTVHSSNSTTDCEAFRVIPPSQSTDIITLINNDGERKSMGRAIGKQRKRTNSNLAIGSNQEPPVITISHSVPHLSSKPKTAVSSLSLKMPLTRDFENSLGHHKIDNSEKESSSQTKAVSSINLKDGGVYLRSTLSALQCEIKSNPIETHIFKSPSSKSLSHQSSEEDSANGTSITSEQSGIIQVYTAYNTGLASGTSLKLHVTPKTTAREVINLVVKQLNMAAVLKGDNGPIYTSEMLDNFCLVAVIGARERCLRDDFKPLHLQNPWRKGRLYVRQKHELLAAIEHSNRKSQII